MNCDNELIEDNNNPTYTHSLSSLFEISGQVKLKQQQKFNPIIDFIKRYFHEKKSFRELNLLDVGIGYGVFLKLCEDQGISDLWGMDPFPDSIKLAKNNTNAMLKENRIEDMPWPFDYHSFDVITCMDVVEHLEKPSVLFKNAKRYLLEDGLLIIRTPNGSVPYRLRGIPKIGIPDRNPTHINVHPPNYWKKTARYEKYSILADWRGEHLTHIKGIQKRFGKLCNLLNLDHRKVPLLNAFEQGYVLILQK